MNTTLVWCGLVGAVYIVAPPQRVEAQQVAVESVRTVGVDEAMSRLVTVQLNKVALSRAIDAVAESARLRIQYRADLINAIQAKVTLSSNRMPLGVALDKVLEGTGLYAVPMSHDLITVKPLENTVITAQGTIRGRVIHAKTKQPVARASVEIEGGKTLVVTAEDGTFRIPAIPGEHRVQVKALGMVRQVQSVTVQEGESVSVEFLLEPSASVLDEVIVTGTVVATERRTIPNPITVITAEEIEKRGITRIEQFFRGEVPSVIALELGSQVYGGGPPGTTDLTDGGLDGPNLGGMVSASVYARGASKIGTSRNQTPLKTYVDGVEILDGAYLGTIDPASIERIEIITGPQAATVYGSGAMGGVMQIFTKKGNSRVGPDLSLGIKYGILENNVSSSLTPAHNHTLNITGGSGPTFSYNGNLSYNYTGQWQPALFSRRVGAGFGLNHVVDRLTVSGSLNFMKGSNGTSPSCVSCIESSPEWRNRVASGEWRRDGGNTPVMVSARVSHSTSLSVSLSGDYRLASWWQHHITIGRNQTDFQLTPLAPSFYQPWDTLFSAGVASGARTTLKYTNTSLATFGIFNSSLTLGADGSTSKQSRMAGCTARSTESVMRDCNPFWYYSKLTGTASTTQSWGGFGSLRIGLFDRVYLSLGLRGEANPNYGQAHRIDWTPSNGVAFTMDHGDFTFKLFGSYGRATRAPSPEMREEQRSINTSYDPASVVRLMANPDLTPEYSRGPQGGGEFYFGSRATLTINHYSQKVTDLIQQVGPVDSIARVYLPTGELQYNRIYQYRNVHSMQSKGWEVTGALNVGVISLKGAYSWNDVRFTLDGISFQTTQGIPDHFGSLSINLVQGGASVSLTTNFVGRTVQGAGYDWNLFERRQSRLNQYASWGRDNYVDFTKQGYAKADLSFLQKVTSWATVTMNITNVGNSYGNEVREGFTALGRQTLLGLSLRFPQR